VSEAVEEHSVVTVPALARVPLMELPVRAMPGTKADYGWLADDLRHRIEQEKRYPRLGRVHGWEGRVVLQAVIMSDGHLGSADIIESSGYEALDQDAVDLLKRITPFTLRHPLGQPMVVVRVAIHY